MEVSPHRQTINEDRDTPDANVYMSFNSLCALSTYKYIYRTTEKTWSFTS